MQEEVNVPFPSLRRISVHTGQSSTGVEVDLDALSAFRQHYERNGYAPPEVTVLEDCYTSPFDSLE